MDVARYVMGREGTVVETVLLISSRLYLYGRCYIIFTTLCSEDVYSSVVVFMTTFLLYWGVFLDASVLLLFTTFAWERRSEV